MKFFSSLVVAVVLAVSPVLNSAPPEPIPFSVAYSDLQAASLTVVTERGSGSGVAVLGTNGSVYVWTACHVVQGAKSDVILVKQMVQNGRTIGRFLVDAEIVSANPTQDLAVLKPRSVELFKTGAKFETSNFVPRLGAPVVHIGSFLGLDGAESFSSGVISYVGRVRDGLVYEQSDVSCFPGSSGGGVWSADGKLVGLIVSGFSETFSFLVPVRRMHAWASAEGHPEWLGEK